MNSHCNFCRWVTADIKTFCPYCGRGIELDFECTEEELLSEGYVSFNEFHPAEAECGADSQISADYDVSSGNGRITETDSTAVFNDDFAELYGTSAIDDDSLSVSPTFAPKEAQPEPIINPVRRNTEKITPAKAVAPDTFDELLSVINARGTDYEDSENDRPKAKEKSVFPNGRELNVKIDSSAVDSFRNGYPDTSADSDSFINLNTVSGGYSAESNGSGERFGDFGFSADNSFAAIEEEYEKQRRAAVSRERRQSFLDRLRRINPRTVFRVATVLVLIGVAAYIWSIRYVIIEGITDFLISLIGPLVLILIIGSLVSSLFRRRR